MKQLTYGVTHELVDRIVALKRFTVLHIGNGEFFVVSCGMGGTFHTTRDIVEAVEKAEELDAHS